MGIEAPTKEFDEGMLKLPGEGLGTEVTGGLLADPMLFVKDKGSREKEGFGISTGFNFSNFGSSALSATWLGSVFLIPSRVGLAIGVDKVGLVAIGSAGRGAIFGAMA